MNRLLIPLIVFVPFFQMPAAQDVHLTLDDAMSRAAEQSVEVALARSQTKTAQAVADLENSPFRPRLSLGTGLAATEGFPLSIEGSAPSIFEVDLTQSLYDRRQKKQRDSARLRQEGSGENVRAVRQQMALKAGLLYLELRNLRHRLQYHDRDIRSLEKIVQITSTRVEAGVAEQRALTRTRLDLARARLDLASTREAMLPVEQELKQATGIGSGASLALEDDPVPRATDVSTPQEIVRRALSSDPALSQLQLEEKADQTALEAFRPGLSPIIHLIGKYSLFSKINNFDKFFQRFQRNNVTAGVSIELPLYMPERAPEEQRLLASLEQTRLRIRRREDDLRLELGRDLANSETLQAREEVARLESKLAREDLTAGQAQYEQGKLPLARLEELRTQENRRWLDYLKVKLEQEKAHLRLFERSGQLLARLP